MLRHVVRRLNDAATAAAPVTQAFTNGGIAHGAFRSGPSLVRGNKGLPGWESPKLPEFLAQPQHHLPMTFDYDPASAPSSLEQMAHFCEAAKDEIVDKLTESGCILFRNTPLKTHADFTAFMDSLGWRTMSPHHYIKFMGARSMTSTQLSSAVRTASDEPAAYGIEPHNEYHTVGMPIKISLFCEKPSDKFGESLITDGRAVLRDLDPNVVDKFERLGCEYEIFYESAEHAIYNNWQQNIHCDKAVVDDFLGGLGYRLQWEEKDALRYWKVINPLVEHPETGERLWMNQIHAHHKTFYQTHPKFAARHGDASFNKWPVHTRYGDGSQIPDSVIEHIREVVWKNTIGLDLSPGDVVFCDNWIVKHGRMPFEGERKVFVSVAYD